jgi:hypothetical protein
MKEIYGLTKIKTPQINFMDEFSKTFSFLSSHFDSIRNFDSIAGNKKQNPQFWNISNAKLKISV